MKYRNISTSASYQYNCGTIYWKNIQIKRDRLGFDPLFFSVRNVHITKATTAL